MTVYGSKQFQAEFNVSRETLEMMKIYERQIQRWTKAINLVSKSTVDTAWKRHIADSAQLYELLPYSAGQLVDIGSGAGFPGLVLAIMGRQSDLKVSLVEADARKCAFLQSMVSTLKLEVSVINERIESVDLSTFDVITARALASLPDLLEMTKNRSGESICLFQKGENAKLELEKASLQWRCCYDLIPSSVNHNSSIIKIRECARVGSDS